MKFIYLIHFATPLHHAQHYLGSTDRLMTRIAEHKAGSGSKLMKVVTDLEIPWTVARLWASPNHRATESYLKKHIKNSTDYCPLCAQTPREIKGGTIYPLNLLPADKLTYNPRGTKLMEWQTGYDETVIDICFFCKEAVHACDAFLVPLSGNQAVAHRHCTQHLTDEMLNTSTYNDNERRRT